MNSFALRQSDVVRVLQNPAVKYVIYGINLLLVIWIASLLATVTWGVFSPDSSDEAVAAVPSGLQAGANPDLKLIQQLPGWHLMGVVQTETAVVKTAVPVDAPDTHLKLTLRGALASDDPDNARAIIADAKGKDEKYAVGDTLPGNAELSEIYPDRVILKRNGRYETLRLPQDTRPNRRVSARTRPVARRSPGRNPQARLAAVRQQIRQDPKSLTRMLRTSLKMDNDGNILGYQLTPGSDPGMFRDLGLKSGDVVTQVNDLALRIPANGPKALQALKSGDPVALILIRDGQQQTLVLDGQ